MPRRGMVGSKRPSNSSGLAFPLTSLLDILSSGASSPADSIHPDIPCHQQALACSRGSSKEGTGRS